ncbi:MAG: hypothetical protein KAZ26_20465, partial [Caldilineaceae bacterium]|nr:hypothetical protein [Caldilineaceae bacterium]
WQAFARYVPEGRAALDHVAAFVHAYLSPPRLAENGFDIAYVRVGRRGMLQPIIVGNRSHADE